MANEERNPFVPGFQEDIFLSYGHIDNTENWITDLHTFLENRVSQLLGTDIRIWRDPRLHGGDVLWKTLEPTVSGSAIFVSILSPRYVRSEPCLREARHFYDTASSQGKLLVDTTCRLVQVVKTPFPLVPAAGFLNEIESIEVRFYEPKPLDKSRFTEYSSREGQPRYTDFKSTADELALTLAGILQKMRTKFGQPEPQTVRRSVFLAETTSDREADRSFVVNEIGGWCDLLPREPLPHTLEELTSQLASQLAGCALSIHLLGARFGQVPEGEESRSLPEIQLKQASTVRRLVWIPQDLAAIDSRQQRFLEEIASWADAGLEVVRSGRQAFVQHVKDVLTEVSRPVQQPVLGKAIYVISDPQDLARSQLKALRDCVLAQGFRIELPVFEGDVEELRRVEEQALRDTDAAIIYYGSARDVWVTMRRKEILKALSTLERGPKYRRALYLCSPETPTKKATYMDLPEGQFPETGGPLLILGDCGEFSCSKLEPLLRTIGREVL